MALILHCFLVLLVSLTSPAHHASCSWDDDEPQSNHDRLWYPRALVQRPNEALARSGNRHVGLRASRWIQPQPEWSARKVAKRTYGSSGQLAYMMSPLNDQVLEASEHLGSNYIQAPIETKSTSVGLGAESCSAQLTTMQLTKQELDPHTGQPTRTCRGLIQVNRCEGYCGSTVQPSVKSPVGLKKECYCCNEGSFKQVQVRLNECYSALDQRLISQDEDLLRSYMDIIVEEPSECKCRRCDGFR